MLLSFTESRKLRIAAIELVLAVVASASFAVACACSPFTGRDSLATPPSTSLVRNQDEQILAGFRATANDSDVFVVWRERGDMPFRDRSSFLAGGAGGAQVRARNRK